MARALVTEPDLLLADEPTGNLDSRSSADVLAMLDALHKTGRTIVLITHEQDVAAAAERIMRFRDGRFLDAEEERGMSWLDTLRSGFEAITSHRLRSSLTVLGILIGIAAVILTVGLGEGATASVNSAINSLGTNLLIVTPGSTTTGLVQGRVRFGVDPDLRQLAGPGQQGGLPRHRRGGAPGDQERVPGGRHRELDHDGLRVDRRLAVGAGPLDGARARSSPPRQVSSDDNVVVLGQTTAEELGLFSPVGETIDIGTVPFTVIGVLNSAGSSAVDQRGRPSRHAHHDGAGSPDRLLVGVDHLPRGGVAVDHGCGLHRGRPTSCWPCTG